MEYQSAKMTHVARALIRNLDTIRNKVIVFQERE
jgi:hypothetical protein